MDLHLGAIKQTNARKGEKERERERETHTHTHIKKAPNNINI